MNKKNLRNMAITAAVFLAVTMPFRSLFRIMEVTEVRPAGALPPVMGLLFGAPGALGCALGNLTADILSGYPPTMCLMGFGAQLLYGYLPYRLWYGGKRGEKTEPRFNSLHSLLKYMGIVFADSLLMAFMLGGMTQAFGIDPLFSRGTVLMFFNNLVFCLLLGIPIIVVVGMFTDKTRRQVLTLNVRFVLMFLFISVLSGIMIGIFAYGELSHYLKDLIELWNRVYLYVFADFFVLCGTAVLFLWYLERNITLPIEKLTGIARNYVDRHKSGEDTDSRKMTEQCAILGRLPGETGYLAAAFGKMLEDLNGYIAHITRITAEKERIRTELQVAARLQRDMLPDSAGAFAGRQEFTIRALMTPAKEVGGDFYDFFQVDDDHLAFLVADVSGKGVPAALFMVVSKTLLRSRTGNTPTPAEVFTETNKWLCADNKDDMFVTAWMGILTISSGRLEYVNAGHNRPLIKKRGEGYSWLNGRPGFVLAGMEGMEYRQATMQLKPGDAIFLYTDGVTEANSSDRELYGDDRLKEALDRHRELEPDDLIAAVWEDVSIFQGSADQFDDITMLAFAYHGGDSDGRGPDEDGCVCYRGPARLERLEELMKQVDGVLEEAHFSPGASVTIRIAVDEIYSNICRYSNALEVSVSCRAEAGTAYLSFEDDGLPYNPLEGAEPDITQCMEDRRPGGLGIYLVRKSMDRMSYRHVDGRNRLDLEKKAE